MAAAAVFVVPARIFFSLFLALPSPSLSLPLLVPRRHARAARSPDAVTRCGARQTLINAKLAAARILSRARAHSSSGKLMRSFI